VLLVIAAGLLIRSFWSVSHTNLGFRIETTATARITPNEEFCSDAQRCISFYRELLQRIEAQPGVNSAALINTLPLDGRVAKRSVEIEGHPPDGSAPLPLVWLNVITPEYFRVMNMPISTGRAFDTQDETSAPVAVMSAATTHRLWPHEEAVGRHFRFSGEREWRTVVGVVPDVRAYTFAKNIPDFFDGVIYVPYTTKATIEASGVPSDMTLAMDTRLDDLQIQQVLRSTVASLNPEVPASDVRSMTKVVADSVATPASTAWLFVAFAGVALLLGVIGIYGVLSFLVANRTREIGIRIALGAQKRDVLWMVMREGAKYALIGISAGLVFALLATRLLTSELYGVSPLDPLTFAFAAFLMGTVTMVACYIPTRRAMRVDPLVALRHE
jgi:predicted permease